jgi:hypothetical protein
MGRAVSLATEVSFNRKDQTLTFTNTADTEHLTLSDVVSVDPDEEDSTKLILTTFANEVFRKGCCCTRV